MKILLAISAYLINPFFLTGFALLAALIPAWRATSINPVTAVRSQ